VSTFIADFLCLFAVNTHVFFTFETDTCLLPRESTDDMLTFITSLFFRVRKRNQLHFVSLGTFQVIVGQFVGEIALARAVSIEGRFVRAEIRAVTASEVTFRTNIIVLVAFYHPHQIFQSFNLVTVHAHITLFIRTR
jgi:hypothetical protein